MCDCDPELVKEYPGSWVVMIQHESEGDWKRGPHSTDFLQNTPLLSHVSISFGFLTDLTRYFVLGFFDQMSVCSFWGGGSWLDFFFFKFGFCWHEPPLRNAVPRETTVTIPWPMNGVQFAPELGLDFRKRTREKTETLGWYDIFFRKSLSQPSVWSG